MLLGITEPFHSSGSDRVARIFVRTHTTFWRRRIYSFGGQWVFQHPSAGVDGVACLGWRGAQMRQLGQLSG